MTFTPPADALTLTFRQPAPLLNMNSREHWAPKARKVAAWRKAAWAIGVDARFFTGKHLPPSFVRLTIDVPDNRRRDASNLAATTKACVDGLIDTRRYWPDDTAEYVTTLEPLLRVSRDATVTIHIWPREVAT